MGCLMTKRQHLEKMKEQDVSLKSEMEMMEQTIGQLRKKKGVMETNEFQVQQELLQLKNKMVELKVYNSNVVVWSSVIRQHNFDLMRQLTYRKNRQGNKSELKER